MIFGFLSRRRNKDCGRGGQQTIGFRKKHVKLRRTEIMNKTVHQPSNYCNWILSLSLALMRSFPHVFVISLTMETHLLCKTRIRCEELPTMMFQQIVFSSRGETGITRCHEQFSTTPFLLKSGITQLHEYVNCDVCVNRSDGSMLDDNFQFSQRLTSAPKTTPQQCKKGDREHCQSS